ncbi:CBS and ACT domain-containing protein [Macrococcoides caseolyticum]|uniref:CBS and ACT domain-containing protein n=1 Tax=Macrococcoides caseolyticum TaxID=69966 RepID=UPI001F3A7648|nr:CBS and ACT domain-containing protein [Macrococcus caseolyticus]MCE4956364.1 CBS domain-containing protein [Macrococcus caseolyticus]
MLVERIMTSPCITFNIKGTIEEIITLMNEKNIHHVPIVDEDMKLHGIISDRDIKQALPSHLSERSQIDLNIPITKIMQPNVITCHPLDFVEEIALDFYHESIGSIPVVKRGKVVGIVTAKDMLNTFIELTGVVTPGTTIQIQIPDIPGNMHEVTEVFHRFKTGIESILVFRDKHNPGKKIVSVRMLSMQPKQIINALELKGFQVYHPMENSL